MWMKGSRSVWSTPAKARRTGNPSPSRPRGAVVIDFTRRGRLDPWATTLGSSSGFSTEMAGMGLAYRRRRTTRPLGASQKCDAQNNGESEHQGDVARAPIEAPARPRDAEPVGVRGAEGSGQDVASPERRDGVES